MSNNLVLLVNTLIQFYFLVSWCYYYYQCHHDHMIINSTILHAVRSSLNADYNKFLSRFL